jgi:glycosyltransferase involved in cell wall biosynthesis
VDSKRVLVLGHPLVVDVNREVWSELAKIENFSVDIVVPETWKSNLIRSLEYEKSESDKYFENIYPLPCRNEGNGSFYFFSPLKLWNILRKKKYDKIILTQETWSFSLACLYIMKMFTRNLNTKIFLWVCQNIKKQSLYFLRHFERIITRDVQRILGCCTETMDVVDWKELKSEKYYLPFSIHPDRFKLVEKDKDVINIGYIGRISEEKGIQDILDAVGYFKGREDIKFHVAGGGNLASKIEEHTDIKFHGILRHREANKFYEDMHIILLPSHTKEFWKEQFGRVIVEGAACGALVVGSDSGAIPEVMGMVGIEKYNFKEANVEDFINKIEAAITDIKAGKDTKVYAEKAVDTFSHAKVAELVANYIQNPEDKRGEITGEGKIHGFL